MQYVLNSFPELLLFLLVVALVILLVPSTALMFTCALVGDGVSGIVVAAYCVVVGVEIGYY